MDESAKHEAAYNSNQPQGEQNDKQCPQHRLTLNMVSQMLLVNMVPGHANQLQGFESGGGNRKLLYR